jgi:hypothetical protein
LTLVIGVGGLLTAGKDVFADRLVDKHGFIKLGMSDVLAESLYALDPVVGGRFLGQTQTFEFMRYQELVDRVGYVEAKKNNEVRRLLQALGTEVGRKLLGENIWVDTARARILELAAMGEDVVITGIRFPNELEMITNLGLPAGPAHAHVDGTTVWVDRPGIEVGTHASEATLDQNDFEYVLHNTGTLQALETRSDALLDEIRDDFA